MLTVVGEIVRSEVKSYTRPAHRPAGVPARDRALDRRPGAADDVLRQDQARRRVAGPHGSRSAAAGVFIGQVSTFRGAVAADQPADGAVRRRRRRRRATARRPRSTRRLLPDLPADQGRRVLGPPAGGRRSPAPSLDDVPELLPDEVRDEYDVARRPHRARLDPRARRPRRRSSAAQRRFRFEEALVTQLVLARRRARAARASAPRRAPAAAACWRRSTSGCRSSSPRASARSAPRSRHDLAQPHPMNRLLQGEVGSGKTLVALRAMLRVVDSGGQAALLAPTEVLAQQHHRSITAMLGDLAAGGMLGGAAEGTTVALLTGSMTKAAARRGDAADGQRRGRHRDRHPRPARGAGQFADLGLVVVDEQHRFGVEQRAALTDKAGDAAARAGDDRDPDPAHRRDDGLRRPRGLHADRAARRPGADPDQRRARSPSSRAGSTGSGSGCARRSTRATRPTSCARGSPATSSSRARPTSST